MYLKKFSEAKDTEAKIIEFFKENPKPSDDKVHEMADDLGIDIHEFESMIYALLGSFFGAGLSKDFKGEVDAKELAMGVKVEMEHTTNKNIAEKISMDHLAEIPDYYTRLAKMEKEAESK